MPSIGKPRRGPLGLTLSLGILTFLVISGLSFLNQGQTLENHALDLAYRFRPPESAPSALIIVGIDEPSFQELQLPWPWPRKIHAELIRRLNDAGARLIVFDVIFAEPTTPAEDQLFAAAMRQAGNVILSQTLEVTVSRQFSRRLLVSPLSLFEQAARDVGVSMVTPDADGVVRRFRLNLAGRKTLPTVVMHHLKPQETLTVHQGGLIDFVGPPRSVETVSYYQVLDQNRPLPAQRIRDRVVLVGRMSEASGTPQSQADAMYTPFFASTGQLMAGVEVQGNIIHTMLNGRAGQEISVALRLGLYLLVTVLFSFLAARLSPWNGLLIIFAGMLLILGFSIYAFGAWNFWMPPILVCAGLPLIYTGNVLTQYVMEVREKRWLRHAFGRYVAPEVVEIISSQPERLKLGGEELEATVLFADLAGFTTVSESMTPVEVIGLLNEFFTPMTQITLEHKGTLDKFIGDCVMALWGAPVPIPDHARRACQAALLMQEGVHHLQISWRERGLSSLRARVGLHSGPVMAGNVGSQERFNYTVLGDTVNLASRLEGANKFYGTEILISGDTRGQLGDAFLVRELDLIQVQGRGRPVTIFELLGTALESSVPEWLQCFSQGRAAYLAGEWEQAARQFQMVLRLREEDQPTRIFLERCLNYLKDPPPLDWSGVFVLDSK